MSYGPKESNENHTSIHGQFIVKATATSGHRVSQQQKTTPCFDRSVCIAGCRIGAAAPRDPPPPVAVLVCEAPEY